MSEPAELGNPAAAIKAAAGLRENELRSRILDTAIAGGLIVNYHQADRLSPVPGWPDLEIVGPLGIIYRELKTMTGRLSDDQRNVGALIRRGGGDWNVWRPVDWYAGTISHALFRLMD